jgi:thioredoxin reductase
VVKDMTRQEQNMEFDHEVIVIGGGAAGLSAAVALARSRRSVLVIDAGEPRNAPADGVHNFLSRDGITPRDLVEAGRAEVRHYGGEVRDGRATAAERLEGGFAVTLADGERLVTRRLVVTTGVVDELPDISGLREHWGRGVLHCPYCHGWEVRDQAIAVIASSPASVHQALLFSQLTDEITLVTHSFLPDAEARSLLAGAGVNVLEASVQRLEAEGDVIHGLRLDDGRLLPAHAVVVSPRLVARSPLLASLGIETVAHPSGSGDHVEVDAMGQSTVPGVYVAGNVTDIAAQVMGAAAAGTRAGAAVNLDLVMTDAREKVAA